MPGYWNDKNFKFNILEWDYFIKNGCIKFRNLVFFMNINTLMDFAYYK